VQAGLQHKSVRLSAIGILALRLVENVNLFDDRSLFVRQERPLRPQTGPKGGLHERWISADRHELAIVDGQFTLELYKLPHMLLITRAEEAAKEDEDQRIAIQESEMLIEKTRPRELRESPQLVLVIQQFNIWEQFAYVKISGHTSIFPL
jgi:hypothetical protein